MKVSVNRILRRDFDTEAIGRHIRILRARRNWSLRELSRQCGIDSAQLARYENGSKKPNVESLKRLYQALGVKLVLESTESLDETIVEIEPSMLDETMSV